MTLTHTDAPVTTISVDEAYVAFCMDFESGNDADLGRWEPYLNSQQEIDELHKMAADYLLRAGAALS